MPWPRRALALTVLLLGTPGIGADRPPNGAFDTFLAHYRVAKPEERSSLVEQYVAKRQQTGGFPIIEEAGEVVFFFLGDGTQREVRLFGDFLPTSFFNPSWAQEGDAMKRIGKVFYRRHRFEPDARLDYRFLVDGVPTLDPRNPRTILSGVGDGDASVLVMPEHELPAEVVRRPEVPRGRLETVDEPWAVPRVSIYLPPGYDGSRRYPTLYTTDGAAWLDLIGLPTILDNLIADRAIEPLIAVMVDAAEDRRTWHYYSVDYIEHFARLVAHVDANYATRSDPAERIHAGTSSGGRMALFTGLQRPDLFGRLALLSPELSGPLHVWRPWLGGSEQPDARLSVWLGAGTYEGSIHRDAELLAGLLRHHGVAVETLFTHQGHSFGTWREAAIAMLRYFLAPGREDAVARHSRLMCECETLVTSKSGFR